MELILNKETQYKKLFWRLYLKKDIIVAYYLTGETKTATLSRKIVWK